MGALASRALTQQCFFLTSRIVGLDMLGRGGRLHHDEAMAAGTKNNVGERTKNKHLVLFGPLRGLARKLAGNVSSLVFLQGTEISPRITSSGSWEQG